eukprot:CAMPEP_0202962464 /NCGR_PEP_ID=MMETSP1396-20130829/6578_1 /ASSEMBLY_ACC=CAM_ASM_000872 /TAXON_ID= /ORGANISM="Pseudokeronopsis sp., Strain Brazil" /LENGTH=103 /DNA_ID=CAMNT_0049683073 /DNA_START=519 /DNA_END=830 /DNA_ORIENTATION=+
MGEFTTAPEGSAMGTYMLIWGVFSICMTVGTFKKSPYALRFVFVTVSILFLLLSFHFYWENAQLQTIAGYEGTLCGLSAIYTGMGELLNGMYGRTILPIGVPS